MYCGIINHPYPLIQIPKNIDQFCFSKLGKFHPDCTRYLKTMLFIHHTVDFIQTITELLFHEQNLIKFLL